MACPAAPALIVGVSAADLEEFGEEICDASGPTGWWEAGLVTGSPGVPAIDATSAAARLDGGALLLDVREPDEWTAGHAPAAVWIPMREVAARQDELPTDRDIVVVCRVGSRSARVTAALRRAGYEATNLAGGMQAWATAGLPIVTDAGDDGVVA